MIYKKRIQSLQWLTPHRALPHGLSGALSMLVGLGIMRHAFLGTAVDAFTPSLSTTENYHHFFDFIPWTFLVYSTLTVMNASAGFLIANKAPEYARRIFRLLAVLQCCLAYYVVRFSPHVSLAHNWWIPHHDTTSLAIVVLSITIRVVDVFMALALLCTMISLPLDKSVYRSGHLAAFGAWIGTLCLATLAAYPIQLALYGQEWLDNVYRCFPDQGVLFSAGTYVPATVVFSWLSFTPTLVLRKIISPHVWGVAVAPLAPLCLLVTVVLGEFHLHQTATQALYIPLHQPTPSSLEAMAFSLLLAPTTLPRKLLSCLLGMVFEEEGSCTGFPCLWKLDTSCNQPT